MDTDYATVSQENLFKNAMEGRWKKVVKAYTQNSKVSELKITKSGDTALHIAVSDRETKVVQQLVDIVGKYASLKIQNVKGNTALHLAATLGDVEMCHAMAIKDNTLVSTPNNKNETPLFLAALNGNEGAFLCLYFHCEECYSLRARNGDTILHVAISGECFSLALKIIEWHPDLVNSVNESGLSPLHILANTPTAFKSSSRLRPLDRIIYKCLFVEEPKVDHKTSPCENKVVGSGNQVLTKAWEIKLFCKDCSLSLAKGRNKKEHTRDAENPQEKSSSIQGISSIQKIHEEKKRHMLATQVMHKLVEHMKSYMNEQKPEGSEDLSSIEFSEEQVGSISRSTSGTEEKEEIDEKLTPILNAAKKVNEMVEKILEKFPVEEKVGDKKKEIVEKQTPILIAAKMGVSEMVEKILEKFPVAIQDVDSENKNVALLAVENRQPHVYYLLTQKEKKIASLLRQVDNKGNNALHLAATYGSYRPWLTPGAALQMQWEHKWYTFVKDSMLPHLSVRSNNEGQTPKEMFNTTHKALQKEGNSWLVKTSESCSVVAALIATVAFATSASVPGGLNNETGKPVFEEKPAFDAFTISSLIALCLSVTALVFFLSILTARYEAHDFSMNLPRKLLLGLTSLFASITSVLVSFCTGHIFLLDQQLRYVAYPLYAATCLPVTIFALAQLPLYYDLIRVIFKKVPQRSYKEYER